MNRELVYAPDTTTICPNCGSDVLVRIGTQSIKMCNNCPTNIFWERQPGEPDTFGGPVEEEA